MPDLSSSRRLIESDEFIEIVPEIDKRAKEEKGYRKRPKYWEIIYWKTRKPLIASRAFVAASLLPENYNINKFRQKIKLLDNVKSPHSINPTPFDEFKEKTVLDPFAGFGSIPLEALRLGVGKVISSDLLPIATFFEKAVLEYPKKYGSKLLNDVKKYGDELLKRIEPYVKELYNDYDGFIGTWEIKCPGTNYYSPMLSQFWLMKMKGNSSDDKEEGKSDEEERKEKTTSGTFKRLVYMDYKVEGNKVKIIPRDLNKELGKNSIKATVKGNKIIVEGKTYEVPERNIKAQSNYARCLQSGNTIPKGKGEEWYVKKALKEWNKNLERFLNGEISLEELKNSPARPSLLVKFKGQGKNLDFFEITEDDEERFWKLFEEMKKLNDLPTEKISPGLGIFGSGFTKWFKIYNPRQLLIYEKIIEIIKEIENSIPDREYAETIITYLVIAFLNYTRYNSYFTSIDSTEKFIRETSAFTRFGVTWNWAEISPLADIIGSLRRSLEHVYDGLEYLINALGNTNSKIEIITSDVTKLSLTEKVDAIITDPPYFNDVPYPEVSDYYYIWYTRVFDLSRITQFESLADKDLGVDRGRKKEFGNGIGTIEYFRERLGEAFIKMKDLVKDDGVIVTFYNHTSPEAWIALLYAGWKKAKLRISVVHTVTTEDETRLTARNTVRSLDKSMVIVWRKEAKGQKPVNEVKNEALNHAVSWLKNYLTTRMKGANKKPLLDLDTYFASLGKVLEKFTSYEKLIGIREGYEGVKELVEKYIFPTTSEAIVKTLGEITTTKALTKISSLYVLLKVLLPPVKNSQRKLDTTTLTMLNVTGDINENELKNSGIIIISDEKKDKTLTLNEPYGKDLLNAIDSWKNMPDMETAILKEKFSSPIQTLHYLEYFAVQDPTNIKKKIEEVRSKSPYVDEALTIAKIFVKVLPDGDIEKEACKKLI
ncbi:DUF1156 domain-containing protein [Sulfurisphaera javensis]|uniref:DUF1156 domain-containing protein n=1 Tax=Sulfurisphaera javensis TaxID=2049879 RepID=A0AAT9GQ65_9CREN